MQATTPARAAPWECAALNRHPGPSASAQPPCNEGGSGCDQTTERPGGTFTWERRKGSGNGPDQPEPGLLLNLGRKRMSPRSTGRLYKQTVR